MKKIIEEAKKQGLNVYAIEDGKSWVLISDGVRVIYAQKNIHNIGCDISAKCSPKARNIYTGSGYLLEEEVTDLKKVDFWTLLDAAQRPAYFYSERAKKTYKPATIQEIIEDAKKIGWNYKEI